ncbi:MAG TPA: cytochrome C oxidase subunit IV family protein [Verrucomicrobiae bacterium]|jgi:cytochrome c oxidase subunit 4
MNETTHTAHAPAGARAPISAHDAEHISKHVKTYVLVFVALLVGTIVTVGLNYLHFESIALTVSIALFVATVKGFLVAGFFMHLISEKKAVYAILIATVFFFAGMMYLTVWSRDQMPEGTTYFGQTRGGSSSQTTKH